MDIFFCANYRNSALKTTFEEKIKKLSYSFEKNSLRWMHTEIFRICLTIFIIIIFKNYQINIYIISLKNYIKN